VFIAVAVLSLLGFAVLSEYSGDPTDYEVTFDPNGGSLVTVDLNDGSPGPAYYKLTTDTGRLYIPDSSFIQGGYSYEFISSAGTFSSWNTQANGLGTTYSPGSLMSVKSNVTLYAIWSPNQYTLTLVDEQGDSPGTVSVDVYYGCTFSTGSMNYTKANYKHVGWSTANLRSPLLRPTATSI
jgi:hypothetical protein